MASEQIWKTAAANLLILEELRRLGEIFSRPPPVPVVVLKGGALAFTHYSDPAIRPLSDIDLLVPEQRVGEVRERLVSAGYREWAQEMAPGLNRVLSHHLNLRRDAPTLYVEVHWTLGRSQHDRYAPDMAWFWEHTEPLHLPFPTPLLTLDPTAHLLYLAAHTILHHGEAEADGKWWYDIHLLVERDGARIQWDELVTRAGTFRWSEAMLRALTRCREEFGTPVPGKVLSRLEAERERSLIAVVERKARPRRKGEKAWDGLRSLDWTGRIGLLRGLLFPSPAFVQWRYRPNPAWTWPFFYPYRWLDILREAIHMTLRTLKARALPGRK
jgi:hypothetical protein